MTIAAPTTFLVADMYSCKFLWGCQILFQLFEGLMCLLCLLELVLFLEELKERESPDAESRDKPTQSGHATRQLLHIMEALGRLHFGGS
jgi:hypothetical protein